MFRYLWLIKNLTPTSIESRVPEHWQARRASNPQPAVLETAALPIELLALFANLYQLCRRCFGAVSIPLSLRTDREHRTSQCAWCSQSDLNR